MDRLKKFSYRRMLLTIVLAIFYVAASLACAEASVAKTGWIKNSANNHYYKLIPSMNWSQAETQAGIWGGHLVTINDREEELWLRNQFGANEYFWIGFNDINTEGHWEWVSGEPVTYTNWWQGEPNNESAEGEPEDTAIMNWGGGAWGTYYYGDGWNDNPIDNSYRGIIETAEMPTILVPTSQLIFIYDPIVFPVVSTNPSQAKPIGVGSVAEGGETLSIHIALSKFSGPIDMYFAISAPSIYPDTIFILKSDGNLQPLSMGLLPWKENTVGPIDKYLFGDIPILSLPPGIYYLYLAVTPAFSLDTYYLWTTYFVIQRDGGGGNFKLPDTGQTECHEPSGKTITCDGPNNKYICPRVPELVIGCTGTGQDGAYTINSMSFTDNGDGSITDNNTGIMWQQNDDGIARTWDQAVAYCDGLTLAGYSDWRLPSKKELVSIVNYGLVNPSIDIHYFPATRESYYWSSTTYVGDPVSAWVVGFYSGDFRYDYHKDSSLYVRCARGAQYGSFGNFTNYGNGTVTDNTTGLMWQRGEGGKMAWQDALSYCKDLSRGGYTDWRLPNNKELESIVDDTRANPAIDTDLFPNVSTPSWYWSSTNRLTGGCGSFQKDPITGKILWWSCGYYIIANCIGFDEGGSYASDVSTSHNVRCVRGVGDFVNLTISKPGTGIGIVTSTPAGIDCGGVCSSAFSSGKQIILTAIPDTDSTFAGWQGCDSTNGNRCMLTMNGNRNIIATFLSVSGFVFKLPDTGQTKCYASDDSAGYFADPGIDCANTGQDGAYSINPMSFTDNGNGTVTDNNTGIMWQQADDGVTRTWDQAVSYCDGLTLASHSDWRLPSKKELISIVDYDIPYPGPTINTTYFKGISFYWSAFYWSSTTFVNDATIARGVSFDMGDVYENYKSDSGHVLCVCGRHYDSFDNFTNNGDGTVRDNTTGLMWQRGEGGEMTWQSALSYCKGLSLGGYADWRLPNIKELESITADTRDAPAINTAFFPTRTSSSYWSSTTTNALYPYSAWSVYFGLGNFLQGFDDKHKESSFFGPAWADSCYVRCARGGQ